MSRRDAVRAGGAAMAGAFGVSAAKAWASGSTTCPAHETACRGKCVNLATNVKNCGKCGHACGAHQVCCNGHCLTVCPSGTTNCSGSCVNTASTVHNCGACGHVCDLPNAIAGCVQGTCVIASCNQGFADCNNNPVDGCETDLTTIQNCGACGNQCTVANGTAVCSSGNCAIASCNSGYANCDFNYGTGCEVNTNTDTQNCGACGTVCTVKNGTAGCTGGRCVIATCNPGYADCNANYSDGCEVNLNTDTQNCGGCGMVCRPGPNVAGYTCSSGSCTITACTAGYSNCDNNFSTGCEVNVQTDPHNCGGCGIVCPSGQTCSAGACH